MDYLDVFCTTYLDDVLVYSEDPKEHTSHVLKVLQRLLDRGLHVDIDKCEFSDKQVKYLGLVVATDGISMDLDKLEANGNPPAPEPPNKEASEDEPRTVPEPQAPEAPTRHY